MKKILVALLVAMLALMATVVLAEEEACTHKYPDGTSAVIDHNRVEPTCTTDGHVTKECVLCQATNTVALYPKDGDYDHEWENAQYQAATCVAKGYWKDVCADCGAIRDGEIAATGVHTNKNEYKAPTCTEPGYNKDYCEHCGMLFDYTDYAALGHKQGRWFKKEGKDTCTTDQIDYYQCTRVDCFEYFTVVTNNVKEHKMGKWAVDVAPTCMKAGVEIRHCLNTGCDYFETRAIKALGHNIVEETIKTEKGVVVGYCLNCKSWVPTNEKPVETPEVKPEDKPSTDKEETKPSKPATKPSTPNKPTTNKDGVTIPATGETMNVAPFIMMLVAIVGLAVTKQKVTE